MFHCVYAGQRKKGSENDNSELCKGGFSSVTSVSCQLRACAVYKTGPNFTLHVLLVRLFLMLFLCALLWLYFGSLPGLFPWMSCEGFWIQWFIPSSILQHAERPLDSNIASEQENRRCTSRASKLRMTKMNFAVEEKTSPPTVVVTHAPTISPHTDLASTYPAVRWLNSPSDALAQEDSLLCVELP